MLGTCWGLSLRTGHIMHMPHLPALLWSWTVLSEAGERNPSLAPDWQQGETLRACLDVAPWSLG